MDLLNQMILSSANDCLPIKHPLMKKAYISHETWVLLERKWEAIEWGDREVAETLEHDIKVRVRKDRENHLLQQLEEILTKGTHGMGLKL